ncbi:MAG: hypothetical protein F4151_05825 [Gammaproteobacteria bacterium]|nr:hypothetical protein [Gammaproteobacteria bacterium]
MDGSGARRHRRASPHSRQAEKALREMRMSKGDIAWLRDRHPDLSFDAGSMTITGALDFRACYDQADGDLIVDCDMSGRGTRRALSRICIGDVFHVEICLPPQTQAPPPGPLPTRWWSAPDLAPFEHPRRASDNSAPWPSGRETGGRHADISRREGATLADLHFYADETCCLGIRLAPEPDLRIDRFILDLVIPFFYRLSFVDTFGLQAAKEELWGEYSHGSAGIEEYLTEVRAIGRLGAKPRDPCPCQSGRRFKDCCAAVVRAVTPPPRRRRYARLCPVAVATVLDAVRSPAGGTAYASLVTQMMEMSLGEVTDPGFGTATRLRADS